MTRTEMHLALCGWMGWAWWTHDTAGGMSWFKFGLQPKGWFKTTKPKDWKRKVSGIPPLTLDWLHECEKRLTEKQGGDYDSLLWIIITRDNTRPASWHATKEQRLEALCRTLWRERFTEVKTRDYIKALKTGNWNLRKPLPKVSKSRAPQRREYTRLSFQFLTDHDRCIRCKGIIPLYERTVHHFYGRRYALLCWVPGFRMACLLCHNWIENHRNESVQLGYRAPDNLFDRPSLVIPK